MEGDLAEARRRWIATLEVCGAVLGFHDIFMQDRFVFAKILFLNNSNKCNYNQIHPSGEKNSK